MTTRRTPTHPLIDLADQARTLAQHIHNDAQAAITAITTWTPGDGYPTATPGAGNPPAGPNHTTDPTATAALDPHNARHLLDTLTTTLRSAIQALDATARTVQRWATIADRMTHPTIPGGGTPCANVHGCPDNHLVYPGEGTRCPTCRGYNARRGHDRNGHRNNAA